LRKEQTKDVGFSIVTTLVSATPDAWTNILPLHPFNFVLCFDVINNGQQPVALTDISIRKLQLNTNLLGGVPTRKQLYRMNPPRPNGIVQLPYHIQPNTRESDIRYKIQVDLNVPQEPTELAKRLNEFSEYEIELEYIYEDMSRSKYVGKLSVRKSFDEFKAQVIDNWKRHKQYEFVVIAQEKMTSI
jgi:hypothetical protein